MEGVSTSAIEEEQQVREDFDFKWDVFSARAAGLNVGPTLNISNDEAVTVCADVVDEMKSLRQKQTSGREASAAAAAAVTVVASKTSDEDGEVDMEVDKTTAANSDTQSPKESTQSPRIPKVGS